MAFVHKDLSEYIERASYRPVEVEARVALTEADVLRLYEMLAENPLTAEHIARQSGTDLRRLSDWLTMQTARGHLQYDAASQRFWMGHGEACAIAKDPSRAFMIQAFAAWRSSRLQAR
ncbi:hypothetical protein [Paraburkholderia kirstenboschensis]|uniref:hypothetical protein n=1 Tax=Paraburkholderia kirstenboschensis TaxID=1245436 RepID=UPI000FFC10C8|nr:hypothetical protein [Paraburkholderia kirstenboschensis]